MADFPQTFLHLWFEKFLKKYLELQVELQAILSLCHTIIAKGSDGQIKIASLKHLKKDNSSKCVSPALSYRIVIDSHFSLWILKMDNIFWISIWQYWGIVLSLKVNHPRQSAHILCFGGESVIAAIGFSGSGRGAPAGNSNENLWSIAVKNRKSSMRANDSPAHIRRPAKKTRFTSIIIGCEYICINKHTHTFIH